MKKRFASNLLAAVLIVSLLTACEQTTTQQPVNSSNNKSEATVADSTPASTPTSDSTGTSEATSTTMTDTAGTTTTEPAATTTTEPAATTTTEPAVTSTPVPTSTSTPTPTSTSTPTPTSTSTPTPTSTSTPTPTSTSTPTPTSTSTPTPTSTSTPTPTPAAKKQGVMVSYDDDGERKWDLTDYTDVGNNAYIYFERKGGYTSCITFMDNGAIVLSYPGEYDYAIYYEKGSPKPALTDAELDAIRKYANTNPALKPIFNYTFNVTDRHYVVIYESGRWVLYYCWNDGFEENIGWGTIRLASGVPVGTEYISYSWDTDFSFSLYVNEDGSITPEFDAGWLLSDDGYDEDYYDEDYYEDDWEDPGESDEW